MVSPKKKRMCTQDVHASKVSGSAIAVQERFRMPETSDSCDAVVASGWGQVRLANRLARIQREVATATPCCPTSPALGINKRENIKRNN